MRAVRVIAGTVLGIVVGAANYGLGLGFGPLVGASRYWACWPAPGRGISPGRSGR
ncbi:MAG TPA: hypothetical protein VGM19_04130 [Armatimonadota bacterium]|jgi:hypothetical protein